MTIVRTVTTIKGLAATTTLNTNTAAVGTDAVVSSSITSSQPASKSDLLVYGSGFAADAIETTLIKTQSSADALAAFLSNTLTSIPELVSVTIDNSTTAQLTQIMNIDLNARVIATESVSGTSLDGFVESIEHVISEGGNKHQLTMLLSSRQRMIGIYSTSGAPYALSLYSAANPVEPPAYAVYGY